MGRSSTTARFEMVISLVKAGEAVMQLFCAAVKKQGATVNKTQPLQADTGI